MINKKEIGLFFGSFNPIHVGHMVLANFMVEFTPMQELWFVVSPQNPFKERSGLLSEVDRYDMVDDAIGKDPRFRVSNIEFTLPKPSYTIDTLAVLKDQYPNYEFSLIMGADNITHLHKWKNAERLVDQHKIYVYPRPNAEPGIFQNHSNIIEVPAPQIEISSSFIRNQIKANKDVRWFLPNTVWQTIDQAGFYR